jgi:hypothetical protein
MLWTSHCSCNSEWQVFCLLNLTQLRTLPENKDSECLTRRSLCWAIHNIITCSGVATFFGTWGEWPQWLPQQKLWTLKKSQLFTEFLYIWLSNLKFVGGWKYFFLNINSQQSQLFIEFLYIWLSNLTFAERRKNFLIQNVHFTAKFSTPLALLPRPAAPLAPT